MGMLYRGAAVIGELRHDGAIVFGKGLVEAHRLESKIARYPRIVISSTVMDAISDAATEWYDGAGDRYIREIVSALDDGIPFLNVFSSEFGWGKKKRLVWGAEVIKPIITMLEGKLSALLAENGEREFEISPKYIWMLSYAERTLEQIQSDMLKWTRMTINH